MKLGIKQIYTALYTALILTGVFMIIRPELFIYAICCITGGICIVYGLIRLAGYFSRDLYQIAFQFDLALGIASLLLGAVIIFCADGFAAAVPRVIGIFTVLSGALKIQSSIDAKRFGLSKWWVLLIGAAVTVIFGVILAAYPFAGMSAIVALLGITLIAEGVQNIFLLLYAVKYN